MIIILNKFAFILQDKRRSRGWYTSAFVFIFRWMKKMCVLHLLGFYLIFLFFICSYWLLSYTLYRAWPHLFKYAIIGFYLILYIGHGLIFEKRSILYFPCFKLLIILCVGFMILDSLSFGLIIVCYFCRK